MAVITVNTEGKMLVQCRRCKKARQSYVRHLCKQCYEALKKQEKRESPLFDEWMLYPVKCIRCTGYTVGGVLVCTDCLHPANIPS